MEPTKEIIEEAIKDKEEEVAKQEKAFCRNRLLESFVRSKTLLFKPGDNKFFFYQNQQNKLKAENDGAEKLIKHNKDYIAFLKTKLNDPGIAAK